MAQARALRDLHLQASEHAAAPPAAQRRRLALPDQAAHAPTPSCAATSTSRRTEPEYAVLTERGRGTLGTLAPAARRHAAPADLPPPRPPLWARADRLRLRVRQRHPVARVRSWPSTAARRRRTTSRCCRIRLRARRTTSDTALAAAGPGGEAATAARLLQFAPASVGRPANNARMCQLLGMNCNTPTDVTFSFTGFAQRGGRTDHHADGWGIAFFEGAGPAPFRRPPAGLRLAGGRADPPLPDQEPQRHRAHPQGHAGRGRAGELPPLRARAVGPLLGVRAQRRPEGLPPAAARAASARSATPTASAPSAG